MNQAPTGDCERWRMNFVWGDCFAAEEICGERFIGRGRLRFVGAGGAGGKLYGM